MKRILFLGNGHDSHLARFVAGLREGGRLPYAVDLLDVSMRQDAAPSDKAYDAVYRVRPTFPRALYRVPLLGRLLKVVDVRRAFAAIEGSYGVVSVQFLTAQAGLLAGALGRSRATVVVTPWGSDIYRVGACRRRLNARLFAEADLVTLVPASRFGADVMRLYHIPEGKTLPLLIGSDVLDDLALSPLTRAEAKRRLLGSDKMFTLTVGYNAAPAQNHIAILEAVARVREQLPQPLLVVLPMTYAGTPAYRERVKAAAEGLGLEARVFETYLSAEEMVWLRKATDLLVHMQKTDAYSTSVMETLLAGGRVVNAEWLRYTELEGDGLPYTLATFADLPRRLTEAASQPLRPLTAGLKEVLERRRWSVQLDLWKRLFAETLAKQ